MRNEKRHFLTSAHTTINNRNPYRDAVPNFQDYCSSLIRQQGTKRKKAWALDPGLSKTLPTVKDFLSLSSGAVRRLASFSIASYPQPLS